MRDTKKRRRHISESKAKVALEAAEGEKTLSQLASEFGVAPVQISQWKRQLLESATEVFGRKRQAVEPCTGSSLCPPSWDSSEWRSRDRALSIFTLWRLPIGNCGSRRSTRFQNSSAHGF